MSKFADKAEFEVRWLPFQLNPAAPKEGANKLQVYNDKFGPGRVAQMMPQMMKVFADEGLAYSLGGLTGNTLDSHRLITWSEQFGRDKQNALVEELFRNYFSEEKYIGDHAVLLAAADKAGLPHGAAQALLADPSACLPEVQALLQGRARGVNGVPFFVIQNKYKLSGAQPAEQFEDLFEQLTG